MIEVKIKIIEYILICRIHFTVYCIGQGVQNILYTHGIGDEILIFFIMTL